MDIIFHGKQTGEEAAEGLADVLRLFKERYHIDQFREMRLSVTLVDEYGDDVELVDSENSQPYRIFEVCRKGQELSHGKKCAFLKLVVDNSKL